MDLLQALQCGVINKGVCTGDGEWLCASQTPELTSINPTTAEPIAKVHYATAEEYETVMAKATEAARHWRTVPAPQRGELIRLMGEALRAKKDLLGSLVALEMGKSKEEGDGEVQEMIDIADFAVGQSRMLYGKTMHSERFQHRMYEQWQPLGVVGVISAFNFPVAVWAWNAFIAAICGNTVVWKPSHKTPLCAIAVQHICNQVMRDADMPGIFSLLICDNDRAASFVDDGRVKLVSFTGSTNVGRQVGERVAKRMGKVLLELGGNNAIIVDETADLSLAVPAVVFGAVGTAGQRCTTTRRLIVHESIADELLKKVIYAYQQITIGDPLDKTNLMGPLIDEAAQKSFLAAIETIKSEGGEILTGGKIIERKGYFVEPTVVKAENHWPIVQQETFAPILYVMTYANLNEAIILHNSVKQGLSSAIFTSNVRHAEQFLSAAGSDCGIANVNIGTSGAEIGGAFGGEKETGGGRESGSDAWQAYMRRQTNTINWSKELPLAQGITFDIE
ncbi:MAG: aldehyde dehydrogenase family protein [Legionellales bacterium]|nr:aldehyde dehydrogenase family protein [Legionellales bacterium]|tara:strand:+ start:5630 stop:7147 length:1518 start_codon:yes stop_codon:yes gene_type:complete